MMAPWGLLERSPELGHESLLGRIDLLAPKGGETLEQSSLFVVEIGRGVDDDAHEQVASAASSEVGNSPTPESDDGP